MGLASKRNLAFRVRRVNGILILANRRMGLARYCTVSVSGPKKKKKKQYRANKKIAKNRKNELVRNNKNMVKNGMRNLVPWHFSFENLEVFYGRETIKP